MTYIIRPERFVLLVLLLMSLTRTQAQEGDSTRQTARHALYGGLGFGSDMTYSGYSLSGTQPYYSADLLYSYNRTWTAAFMAYHLAGTQPTIAFYDFSLGYRKTFNSWWDVSASLAAYFTAKELKDQYFSDFAYLSVSGGFDWRILYTRAVFSTILDDSNTRYFQLKNSRYFSTRDFWKDKAYIDFNPTANLLWGKQYTITDTYTEETEAGPVDYYTYGTSFGLLDAELSLPVSFNYNQFTLEVEPLYNIPVYKDPDFPAREGLLLFINLYFKIL